MQGLTEKMPELVDTAFKMIIGFIDGLASAIEKNHNELFEVIGHLIKAIVDALLDGITSIVKGAGELIDSFVGEFDLGKIGNTLSNIGSNLVQGIINGIGGAAHWLWDKATELANGALNNIKSALGIASPAKEGIAVGKYLVEGVGIGIDDGADTLYSKAAQVAYGVVGAFNSAIDSSDTSFSPSVDTSYLKSNLSNTSYRYIPNDLATEMTKYDKMSIDQLRLLDMDTSDLLSDYNSMSYEEQMSENGQALLEMIDYNERLNEYANARLTELDKGQNLSNTYSSRSLKQGEKGNSISSEILTGVGNIGDELQKWNSSGSSNYSNSSTSGSGSRADTLMQTLLNEFGSVYGNDTVMDSIRQVWDDPLYLLQNLAQYDPNQDSLWNDYYAATTAEEKNNIVEMMRFNQMLADYYKALVDELSQYGDANMTYYDYMNGGYGSTQPVHTAEIESGIARLSDNVVGLSPTMTSSMGQMVAGNTQSVNSQIEDQTYSMTSSLDSINSRLDSLLTSHEELIEAVNNSGTQNIYMDTGSLVGAISSAMDQQLGRAAILSERGV